MAANPNRWSPLTRVLTRPFGMWGLAALATSLTLNRVFKHHELAAWARLMLYSVPIFLAIMFVVAFVKGVRKLDEMGRRIHMQAASTSFLLTVILTFVLDGLKSAGVYTATLSDIDTATIVIWVASLVFFSLRYR
jgi:hypothetical protein